MAKWDKGKSGNPKGASIVKAVEKPLAKKNRFVARLQDILATEDHWDEIIEAAIMDAKKGDRWSREWLSKWAIGTPESVVNAERRGNQLVQFNITYADTAPGQPEVAINQKTIELD